MSGTVLVIDDEASIRKALKMILSEKYQTMTAERGSEGLALFKKKKPDIVLLDIGLPDMDGLDVLKDMKDHDPEVKIIMITARNEVKTIVKATKLGAYDYLVKPIDAQEVLLTVQHAMENRQLKEQLRMIQQPSIERYRSEEFISRNDKMNEVLKVAGRVSQSIDTPILIVGESGSGKGVLARIIHYRGQEIPGPFVTVNCGAIVRDLVESELFGYERGAFTGARTEGKKGRFEEAAGGTIFLDEIGAMPMDAQAKLLSVLEDRALQRVGGNKNIKVTARVIAATNSDLEKAVSEGRFRQDLYYRLNVVRMEVPPLRERPEDVLLLTRHFMDLYNNKFGKRFSKIAPGAETLLLQYSWPGNVRELRNTIERSLLIEDGNTLLPEHFPFAAVVRNKKDQGVEFEVAGCGLDFEKVTTNLIKEALRRTRGNVQGAARLLNMPVHKLRYRLEKNDLSNQ